MINEKRPPEVRTEIVIKRRYKMKNGEATLVLVESKDPAVKSEYYTLKEISIGPENAKRKIRIAFESMEAADNDELMHLLHDKKQP